MKLGIVGTGNIAYRHFEEFSKIDGVKIEAACDVNSESLNLFTKKFGNHIRQYSNVDEMLEKEENFDGVCNNTPDRFHKEVSLKILEKGINIFSENIVTSLWLFSGLTVCYNLHRFCSLPVQSRLV